jgi:hypothetical protein
MLVQVEGRLGSWLWGYHHATLLRYGSFVHRLQFRPSSPGSLHVKQHETLLVKAGTGREMAGQFGLWFWVPHQSKWSFTCLISATSDRRLYFPSEGRHAIDFARNIQRLRPGSKPRSWEPETSMLTTRPPKPLLAQLRKSAWNLSAALNCGGRNDGKLGWR